ncbi:MAG: hypothetical protein IMW90_07490 [Thermogemmatispora sp.]|jgi:hypothetical protein|uniref:Uncharacterized protein n=1 Tax=Thermogemmatispora aurantia TaxID=2045279 RepID=A0A5J4K4K4_9CHLR|nr:MULTISPECIES: hypothetical protein [Thermogemmatispora]MBE3565560.1 hypothetical protein [Thermogemmatispora sp.]GER81700.1 hypothetical protein KTAU_03380 [Thermogemmatispora aurantia]
MDETVLGYIGFIVAALILAWAALEIGKRLNTVRRTGTGTETADRLIKLDPSQLNQLEEMAPEVPLEDDEDEPPYPPLRSRLNGHYSNKSKQTF